jgi:hypothetical protein
MELHGAYWRKQLDALATQAEEMRVLSSNVTAATTEPLKAQMTRGMDELGKG